MEKDITTNNLIEKNDIFADIVNVNLFDGKRMIKEDDLESVPIDTNYKALDGKHHRLFRDCLKKVRRIGGCIALLGCENQMAINNVMPVRDMGYNYTIYAKQIQDILAENKRNGHSAYAKVLHDNQKLLPVATIVLYYGRKRWKKPLSLMDVLDIPENDKALWENLISDHKIKVIHMANQPKETREKYESDYRIIADYLAYHGNKKELDKHLRKDEKKLIHVEQVLDLLHALSGDKRFESIKEIYLKSEDKEEQDNMCLLLDMCEEEGIKKGMKKGKISGILLFEQVMKSEAEGKKAGEIAKELKEDVSVIEDIIKKIALCRQI